MENSNLKFSVDYDNCKTNEKSIIVGKKYRFTVLTERLIRLEYNEEGIFEDRPTEFALNRNFPLCQFTVKEDAGFLQISTKYFNLEYQKEKHFLGTKVFPGAYLRVTLNNSDRSWYYNHPEVRNYGGSNVSLDDFSGSLKLDNGLYSSDGFASIDDSYSMVLNENGIFEARTTKGIDIYLFVYRKDFGLCLSDYYKLTTLPDLIPRYTLGVWWSKNISYSEQDIKTVVENFASLQIPISVFLLDSPWNIKNKYNDKTLKTGFTFNGQYIKNPTDIITFLHNNNIRIGLNIDPSDGITSMEPKYQIVKEYLQTEDELIPYNPENIKWVEAYLKVFIEPLKNVGIDIFWIDYNPIKNDLQKLFLLNYYHIKYMEQFKNIRPVILSRNSKIAPHKYPICYSGRTITSWNTLKQLPFYNSSAANSGISWWSHDIGGFYKGIEDPELYLRYIQFGTYSPIFRISSDNGKYYKKEPWKLDYKTQNIAKEYFTLRYRLIPYIYSESYKFYKKGVPLIQPLYYKVPTLYDDPKTKNQYYFGSQMLVSPIIEKKDTLMNRVIHRFYLPKGIWYDFKTGKKYIGGKDNVFFYKDEDYPVFVLAGSIIPMAIPNSLNDTDVPSKMEIQVFPGNDNKYELYEDDGKTQSYKDGFYTITTIEYNYRRNDYAVAIKPTSGRSGILPNKRDYKIRFKNVKKAETVIAYVNDTQIPTISYEDDNDFIIEVENVPTTEKLIVNCRGRDIELESVKLINQDIDDIISDLPIETLKKERISNIMFSRELPIKKKRIEIRKLKKIGIDQMFIRLFLKLLEYVESTIKE